MTLDEAGLEDAAILLMSLGEEEAAAVLKHLSPREVQGLGTTIARMTSVPKERLDKVLAKFTDTASSRSPLVSEPRERLDNVLAKFPDAATGRRPIVADTRSYVKNVLERALGEDKAKLRKVRSQQNGEIAGIVVLAQHLADRGGEM